MPQLLQLRSILYEEPFGRPTDRRAASSIPEDLLAVLERNPHSYLFVSYSHRDVVMLQPWIRRLDDYGIRLKCDEGRYLGSHWFDAMAGVIERSSGLVFVCSKCSRESISCHREVDLAVQLEKPIVYHDLRYHSSTGG